MAKNHTCRLIYDILRSHRNLIIDRVERRSKAKIVYRCRTMGSDDIGSVTASVEIGRTGCASITFSHQGKEFYRWKAGRCERIAFSLSAFLHQGSDAISTKHIGIIPIDQRTGIPISLP